MVTKEWNNQETLKNVIRPALRGYSDGVAVVLISYEGPEQIPCSLLVKKKNGEKKQDFPTPTPFIVKMPLLSKHKKQFGGQLFQHLG